MEAARENHGVRSWEWEMLALVLAATAFFFLRLSDIPFVGEETRRAIMAREMTQSGDWICPTQQGVPRNTKPPLQFWVIALATAIFGSESEFAVRFPSALAMVLTTLAIYLYTRAFLSRAGALASGLGFLGTIEIMHSGRFAQIDPLFTFFLSGALFAWHYGYLRGWPAWWTWSAGYTLASLAALTKGIQTPVYFSGSVVVYLLLRRDWRMLFSPAHALGIGIFAVILGSWLFPFWKLSGTAAVLEMWIGESYTRTKIADFKVFLVHFVRFPVEVFLCALPTSVILLAFLSRDLRRHLGPARSPALFLGVCLAVSVPTVWLPHGGEARYLMPVYPCAICLAGIALDRGRFAFSPQLARCAQSFRTIAMAVMVGAMVGIVLWSAGLLPKALGVMPSSAVSVVFSLAGMAALAGVFWRASSPTWTSARCPFLWHTALIGFFALAYTGIAIDRFVLICRDMQEEVAAARAAVPEGARLVSLDWVHHRFTYFYPEPVPVYPWRQTSEPPPLGSYFCFDAAPAFMPDLPFSWEPVVTVAVDRFKTTVPPRSVVVIARRI